MTSPDLNDHPSRRSILRELGGLLLLAAGAITLLVIAGSVDWRAAAALTSAAAIRAGYALTTSKE